MTDKNSSNWEKALSGLVNSQIPDHKIKQGKEKAKRLSVNTAFQEAIRDFRERWNIKPQLFDHHGNSFWALGKIVFGIDNLHEEEPPDAEWKRLINDLKRSLCIPFNLDELHDFGLAATVSSCR